MKEGFFESFDKEKIYYYEWDDVDSPKGVVQIIHGMSEHAFRYNEFAKELNKAGYIVFADDHRAHGKTAGTIDKIGKYDKDNLFLDTLQDEIFISKMLKKYNLPLYVFGHSYGSFLTQAYIEKCKLYDKAIICGSALMKNRFKVKAGLLVAKLTMKNKGKDAPAKLIEKMSFNSYNKKCKSGSWINTDEEECKKYYSDPLCTQPFSAKFYVDFFGAFKTIYQKEYTNAIDKDKPLLLIAGKEDPVGDYGKSVVNLYKFYIDLEIKNVKMKLYDNARHEILNEPKIKAQVVQDIINFIEEK